MHTKEEKLQAFSQLLDVMDALRERCPWNAEQTMSSLRAMTEEEVYELSDAVIKEDNKEIAKEIGDLMYHLVFYAKIGEECQSFDIADAIESICRKMIFRHPHVFGSEADKQLTAKEIADNWELIKAKEKGGNKTIMSGIPESMPAILKAMSIQQKARGCGFDWEKKEDVWDKVSEEIEEVSESIRNGSFNEIEEEFGDVLFAIINAARLYDVDAEKALNLTCNKFRRRFNYIEENTIRKGLKFSDMTLAELDTLWNEAKTKKI